MGLQSQMSLVKKRNKISSLPIFYTSAILIITGLISILLLSQERFHIKNFTFGRETNYCPFTSDTYQNYRSDNCAGGNSRPYCIICTGNDQNCSKQPGTSEALLYHCIDLENNKKGYEFSYPQCLPGCFLPTPTPTEVLTITVTPDPVKPTSTPPMTPTAGGRLNLITPKTNKQFDLKNKFNGFEWGPCYEADKYILSFRFNQSEEYIERETVSNEYDFTLQEKEELITAPGQGSWFVEGYKTSQDGNLDNKVCSSTASMFEVVDPLITILYPQDQAVINTQNDRSLYLEWKTATSDYYSQYLIYFENPDKEGKINNNFIISRIKNLKIDLHDYLPKLKRSSHWKWKIRGQRVVNSQVILANEYGPWELYLTFPETPSPTMGIEPSPTPAVSVAIGETVVNQAYKIFLDSRKDEFIKINFGNSSTSINVNPCTNYPCTETSDCYSPVDVCYTAGGNTVYDFGGGSTCENGMVCTYFVMASYQQAGYPLPGIAGSPRADKMLEGFKTMTNKLVFYPNSGQDKPEPGDVMFFDTPYGVHVTIVAEVGKNKIKYLQYNSRKCRYIGYALNNNSYNVDSTSSFKCLGWGRMK